ncbi:MAG TPA: hypothetical protein VL947_14305 [Cytophagales bacterium]|nr:hypothetical protein [Cytophagales bacterium]
MKNIICIIARTNSKRLERKALKEVNGISMIERIITKMKKSKLASDIYICTSWEEGDQVLVDIAKKHGIKSYCGHPDAPVERLRKVAEMENADNVVRVTGDNIFTDEVYLDLMFKYHTQNNADYTRTEFLPLGATAEVIKAQALYKCFETMPIEFSEYLLMYIFQPKFFDCQVLIPSEIHKHADWSLTVDTPADWTRTEQILEGQTGLLNYDEIVKICNGKKIDHLVWDADGLIKLPGDFFITYQAFRAEMEMRIQKSKQVQISHEEYLSAI